MLSPIELLAFQIQHYTKRLSEARTTEERAFLRKELYNLKKREHEQAGNKPTPYHSCFYNNICPA